MAIPKIFTPGDAPDPAYINLRNAASPEAKVGHDFTERLWDQYHLHADSHFLAEIKRDFIARFWEMYLTCALLQHAQQHGYEVSCPKPGPDVLIKHEGRRIWIEAVTATDGQVGKPDSVIPPELGKGGTVPDEQLILRYRSAIEAKHLKHLCYLSNGILSREDPYIIAVNGYALSYRWADAEMPRILKAVFPLGHLQFLFDRDTRKLTGSQHQFRPNIPKLSGNMVSTDLFVSERCKNISAVIHSYANPCMVAQPMGSADFLLIHNPLAASPLPCKLVPSRREYTATPVEDGYILEYVETDEAGS
jgi:type I restriction enzyme S subunit